MMVPLFLNLGSGEIFLIVLVILLFFGSNSIPTLARSLGKGMREFRDAASGLQQEIQNSVNEIRESVDLSQEIKDVNEAARTFTRHIQEGTDSLKENLDPEKALGEKSTVPPQADPVQFETTVSSAETPVADVTDAAITDDPSPGHTLPPQDTSADERPPGLPNTVRRKG